LGVFATAVDFCLINYVVPYCKSQEQLLKQNILQSGSLPVGKSSFEFKQYDKERNLKQMIYVGHVDDNELKNVTMMDFSKPEVLNIIQAQSGMRYPDRWELRQANSYTVSQNREMLFFSHIGKITKSNIFENGGQSLNQKFSFSAHNFSELKDIIEERERNDGEAPGIYYIKLWEKITLPVVCLVIVLSAVPLAIRPPRQGADRGFIFALCVLFGYYLVRAVSLALAHSGIFHLGGLLSNAGAFTLATWLPPVLIGLLGGFLLVRKSRVL
jgi:lipopolysaccharide export system permease protein